MDIPCVVTAEQRFPIQPENINTENNLSGAFGGDVGMETAAWHLILFCQERGEGWRAFPLDVFLKFYKRHCSEQFCFHGLDHEDFIVFSQSEYHFTQVFIERCYSASPAARPADSLSKQAT